MTKSVTIPLAELADSLGADPEGLGLALELAELLGGAAVKGDMVELPAHAVARLGLVPDERGRWSAPPDDALDLDAVRTKRRGRPVRKHRGVLPLLYEGQVPDRRTPEPLAALARADDPPPDRIASLCAWLARWTAATPPPGPPPSAADVDPFQPGPGPHRAPRAPRRPAMGPGKPPALRRPGSPVPPRVGPAPARSSFSLTALRARLDDTGKREAV